MFLMNSIAISCRKCWVTVCENTKSNTFYPGIAAYIYRQGECGGTQEGRDIKVFIFNAQGRNPLYFLGDKSPLPLQSSKPQSLTPKKFVKNGQEIYEVYFKDSNELVLAKQMGDRIAVMISQNTFIKDENVVRKIMASLGYIDSKSAKSVPYYTYINQKYGASFEIPPTLVVNFSDESSANIGDDSGFTNINFTVEPTTKLLEQVVSDYASSKTDSYKKIADLLLDGHKAIKLQGTGTGETNGLDYTIIVINNGNLYRIWYRYLDESVINHLIESFRFSK